MEDKENKLKHLVRTEDIKSLIEQIHNNFDQLISLRDQSKQELSDIDKELSNHYHNIEGTDINHMFDSHLMVMKLKDILYRRREAKINHTLLESFVTALERNVSKTKKRTTEIIQRHDEVIQEIITRAK